MNAGDPTVPPPLASRGGGSATSQPFQESWRVTSPQLGFIHSLPCPSAFAWFYQTGLSTGSLVLPEPTDTLEGLKRNPKFPSEEWGRGD